MEEWIRKTIEERERFDSDVLDNDPNVDPLDWIYALRAEIQERYPTLEEYNAFVARATKYVPKEQYVSPDKLKPAEKAESAK